MDAIFGILNNPLVLAGVGMVVKFVPGIRQVLSNRLIPFLTLMLAWLGGVMGPQAAHAAGGPLALPLATFGLGGALGGFGAAMWQAAQSYILHEWLLRHVLPKRPLDSKQ